MISNIASELHYCSQSSFGCLDLFLMTCERYTTHNFGGNEPDFNDTVGAFRSPQKHVYRLTGKHALLYSPLGPYFSKLTLTCSSVSPVFSFTPKFARTSGADLVWAFSILRNRLLRALQRHVFISNYTEL